MIAELGSGTLIDKLREKFLELPKFLNENIKVVDASKDKDSVFDDIKKEVDNLL